MEQGRYMLIHMDKYVYRFKCRTQAYDYAGKHCSGAYEYYVIVDTEKNEVISKWYY